MQIHDINLVLNIVNSAGQIRSGDILKAYNEQHAPMTLRNLHRILRKLEKEGKVTLKVTKVGTSGGKTTLVSKKGSWWRR